MTAWKPTPAASASRRASRPSGLPRSGTSWASDGAGALIGSLDTGVDGNHPALRARWRGNHAPVERVLAATCWAPTPTFPNDGNSHGTHTTGTMTGLAPDDTIGVAPGRRVDRRATPSTRAPTPGFDNDIIDAFQWFTDPDGNPGTLDDVPDVVQNSWGVNEDFAGYVDCDSRWWAVIDNCEAAGVVVTWSAGNEGSARHCARPPTAPRRSTTASRWAPPFTARPTPSAASRAAARAPAPTSSTPNTPSSPRSPRPASTSTAPCPAAATATRAAPPCPAPTWPAWWR